MKTPKINWFNSLIRAAFLGAVCVVTVASCQDAKSQTAVAKPEMDIHTAVLYGNLEAIEQHIAAGTDLDSQDPMGGYPLIAAATFGHTEIAEALIDGGADIEVTNKDGSTALHAAAFFCRVEIVQALLDADADKTVRNNFGSTARESVMGPFPEVKPIYEMMQSQLGALGLKLDMEELEKTRPVVAMMLQ